MTLPETELRIPGAVRASLPPALAENQAQVSPPSDELETRERGGGSDTGGFSRCIFCSRPVSTRSTLTWRSVKGWERPRSGGGTNALALREPTHRFACDSCISKKRAGLDPSQGSLYPDDNDPED